GRGLPIAARFLLDPEDQLVDELRRAVRFLVEPSNEVTLELALETQARRAFVDPRRYPVEPEALELDLFHVRLGEELAQRVAEAAGLGVSVRPRPAQRRDHEDFHRLRVERFALEFLVTQRDVSREGLHQVDALLAREVQVSQAEDEGRAPG